MSSLFATLKNQIDALEQQVMQLQPTQYQEHYFDEHLFHTNKIITDYSFYLDKIKQTHLALIDSVENQKMDQLSFLSETLVNQITALTRELATHQLRHKESDIFDESLAEKHSRHLDYLRRLQERKYELEFNVQLTDYSTIATLDNRIYRCEQAIKKIEIEMENDSN